MSNSSAPIRVCVFGSVRTGSGPTGLDAARRLSEALHKHNVELIYGGGTTGLVGEASRTRTKLGGVESVLGVIPYALLDRERDLEDKAVPGSRGKLSAMMSALGISRTVPNTLNTQPTGDIHNLPPDPTYGRVVGVQSLARRKRLMIDLVHRGAPGSGFIALPGAFGSLDEIFEVLVHRQLGVHSRPMVLVNIDGFWDGFHTWTENALEKGFLGDGSKQFVKIVNTPEEAVDFCLQSSK